MAAGRKPVRQKSAKLRHPLHCLRLRAATQQLPGCNSPRKGEREASGAGPPAPLEPGDWQRSRAPFRQRRLQARGGGDKSPQADCFPRRSRKGMIGRAGKPDPFAETLAGWLKTNAGRPRKERQTLKRMHADLVTPGFTGTCNGERPGREGRSGQPAPDPSQDARVPGPRDHERVAGAAVPQAVGPHRPRHVAGHHRRCLGGREIGLDGGAARLRRLCRVGQARLAHLPDQLRA